MVNIKITFLLGAGCETDYGLPSGAKFKSKTILANNAKDFVTSLNGKSDFKITSGHILHPNASSVLYQTVKEYGIDAFDFFDEEKLIISSYIAHKDSDKQQDENEAYKEFRELYRRIIYDEIKAYQKNESQREKFIEDFLEKASFFSFIDSYFNYLRRPDDYKNEVGRVIKLYYSAYSNILNEMGISLSAEKGIMENRKKLKEDLETIQYSLSHKNIDTYYSKIKNLIKNNSMTFINCNYTTIAKEVLNVDDVDIAYIHGKLDLFEDIQTKQIKPIEEFDENELIIPYILIQSGVKPIISPVQIKEFNKMCNFIEEADKIVILGYGLNSDDEHITNILRHYMNNSDKKMVYFIHDKETDGTFKSEEYLNDEKERVCLLLNCKKHEIEFWRTSDFDCWLSECEKRGETREKLL